MFFDARLGQGVKYSPLWETRAWLAVGKHDDSA